MRKGLALWVSRNRVTYSSVQRGHLTLGLLQRNGACEADERVCEYEVGE